MSKSQLFIVGKRGSGVLFVRTEPLRVSLVSHETILAYEAGHPGIDGYARVAAAAKAMLVQNDSEADSFVDMAEMEALEARMAQGQPVREADIAMVGGVADEGWDFNRIISTPLDDVMTALGGEVAGLDIAVVGDIVGQGWDTNRKVHAPAGDRQEIVAAGLVARGGLHHAILSDAPNTIQ